MSSMDSESSDYASIIWVHAVLGLLMFLIYINDITGTYLLNLGLCR